MQLYSILLMLLCLTISACTSTVTSIKHDQTIQLSSDKGYVLLGIQTNLDLKAIKISGPQNILLSHKDLKKGTNYFLIDLKIGRYTIERIDLSRRWHVGFSKEELWHFDVSSDGVNYVGHLEIVTRGYWRPVSYAELVNRSSEALEFLEQRFPTILSSRQLVYGGPGEDGFFNLVNDLSKETI